MARVASGELRSHTRALLKRVDAGEEITVTVNGREVAHMVPVDRRSKYFAREELIREVLPHPADPALRDELTDLLGTETTDDLEF
ncbi:type II toxin-antitoxin system Phd/YefM family antitoxin [Candidatus Microthrix parvicella]|jgi:prevent-host-death family protein|nr:type II toxin-antitoxin system prevent-host-death family antitoxin [Candidatus Microthrix parvicella]